MSLRISTFRVGLDVGGTFTDVVVYDAQKGWITEYKRPTDRDDLARGIIQATHEALLEAQAPAEAVDDLHCGTTIATNALLEGKLARTGLLTTRGFRDVLEIARFKRDRPNDMRWRRPAPVVPRHLRREINERTAADGAELEPVDLEQLDLEVGQLRSLGVESIAICFLHSYMNSSHEVSAQSRIRERHRDILTSRSSEILPAMGEYERTSSVVLNAALLPVMSKHLRDLDSGLRKLGIVGNRSVIQSSGGAMNFDYAQTHPVRTLLSGPAGGVVASAHLGKQVGEEDLITLDMGGTSTDVSLLHRSKPTVTAESRIGGYPFLVPTIDIVTIGAGGGSVAWLDRGGAMKVGPRSAGSDPGPACYGRGNTEATLTDALVVLGYISQGGLLAGRMRIDADLAYGAVAEVGRRCNLGTMQTAEGILRIATVNMVRAVKTVSVQRGHDPRDFALFPFGGAGPLTAAAVAAELRMHRVLVPPSPGTLSAVGAAVAPQQYEETRSFLRSVDEQMVDELARWTTEMASRTLAHLPDGAAESVTIADMRYHGQLRSLPVEIGRPGLLHSAEKLVSRWEETYQTAFGTVRSGQPVEIVKLRVLSSRPSPVNQLIWKPTHTTTIAERPVWVDGRSLAVPVVPRQRLDHSQHGPLLIEEYSTVTWVPEGWTVLPLSNQMLLLKRLEKSSTQSQ